MARRLRGKLERATREIGSAGHRNRQTGGRGSCLQPTSARVPCPARRTGSCSSRKSYELQLDQTSAWGKLTQFSQDFGGEQKAKKETRLKFSNGSASKSVAEDLQAPKARTENLFKPPTHDETALGLLDQRPEFQGTDDLPDATCIFNASRRLKHAAGGGEGGLRAEHPRRLSPPGW